MEEQPEQKKPSRFEFRIVSAIGMVLTLLVIFIIVFYPGAKSDYSQVKAQLDALPEADVNYSVNEKSLDSYQAYSVWHTYNTTKFIIPVQMWNFYEGVGVYHKREISNDTAPLNRNDKFVIGEAHQLSSEQFNRLERVDTYLILENQTGYKFKLVVTTFKGVLNNA